MRREWIWMTANRFGRTPARLHLLRGGLVQWNDGAPHGLWKYYATHDVLCVRVHWNACERKAKDHVFKTVPGSDARAHVAYDPHFNVMLLPPSADAPSVDEAGVPHADNAFRRNVSCFDSFIFERHANHIAREATLDYQSTSDTIRSGLVDSARAAAGAARCDTTCI